MNDIDENHEMSSEKLYIQAGRLIKNAPNPENLSTTSYVDLHKWISQVYALANHQKLTFEIVELRIAQKNITADLFDAYWSAFGALQRIFAVAELQAPASLSGAFVYAGKEFDAFIAVGKILSQANNNVLIVDPYMDETALVKFAVSLAPKVSIQLLTERTTAKPSFVPSVQAWKNQYGNERKLNARFTGGGALHDRLIIVDDKTAWILTQSLKDFAKKSPASLVKADDETAMLKVKAYAKLWESANEVPE